MPYFHSVMLDEEKCKGCTNCIKRCPTEAIRVRNSKAKIIDDRCIDCGECIRVCPYHAKKALTDPLEMLEFYKYRIVLPAPSLYGQFKNAASRNHLLSALKMIGFNEIFEVAKAAEIVSDATKKLLAGQERQKPLISSACPAVVKLIQVRFPYLIDNIVKLQSPMEIAARIIKEDISKNNNIAWEDIGVFFITPCAAKVTSVKAPYDSEKSAVDGVISIKDVYIKLLDNLGKINQPEILEQAGFEGIRWANSGGESLALDTERFLAVDGIHNVISIFEEIENDRIKDIDFIEALACTGGCLGGPLTVENLYVAKTTMKKFIDEAKHKSEKSTGAQMLEPDIVWKGSVEYKPVMKLDIDFIRAMKKLEALEDINNSLPGLDCGACGAPSCRALAEDIVRGHANEADCIFKLKEKIRSFAAQMMELDVGLQSLPAENKEEDDRLKK
ncbi:MAG: Fe-S cluster domain protein [Clostridiales bacterium]|jgi:iron only hydrogenase large subunit-like protein|nr:Fe-S cluster domain protein [Clostridiales bacterium]